MCSWWQVPQLKVQPRVCGEYASSPVLDMACPGSTPRMRGIYLIANIQRPLRRFNPAYAGNIDNSKTEITAKEVQPRVCGEYNGLMLKITIFIGSTPRMRGISKSDATTNKSFRFNPAYAGNMPFPCL